eukprot:g40071.t1
MSWAKRCLAGWWKQCRENGESTKCPQCRKSPSRAWRTSHLYEHEIVRWQPVTKRAAAKSSSSLIDMTEDDSEFSQFQPLPGAAVIAHQDREYELAEAKDLAVAIRKGGLGKRPRSVHEEEQEQLRWAIEESIRAAQPVPARSGQKQEDVAEVGVITEAGIQSESRAGIITEAGIQSESRADRAAKFARRKENVASNVTSVEAVPVSNSAQDSVNVASAEVVSNGGAQVVLASPSRDQAIPNEFEGWPPAIGGFVAVTEAEGKRETSY